MSIEIEAKCSIIQLFIYLFYNIYCVCGGTVQCTNYTSVRCHRVYQRTQNIRYMSAVESYMHTGTDPHIYLAFIHSLIISIVNLLMAFECIHFETIRVSTFLLLK